MEVIFILNNPAYPGNVGSAARAMKTMGFSQMRLVNACDINHPDARNLGYASHDVIDQALEFDSLQEALRDIDLVIGTTSKKRTTKFELIQARDLNTFIDKKEETFNSIGIVFGNEENGLSNDELSLCDVLSTIPLATSYPSLNLSQSVMVYAYELARLEHSKSVGQESASQSELLALKKKSSKILEELNVSRNPLLYQRMKDRIMMASADDVHLMLSFIKFLERKMKGLDL